MADPDVGGQFAIVIDKRGTLPEVEARVELAETAPAAVKEVVAQRLEARLMEAVRLRITVNVGDPRSIPRTEMGKAKRVFERTDDHDPLTP